MPSRRAIPLLALALAFVPLALASSGDRNPTFQHCLKGCALTYCDPSQPPVPAYLSAFGWTCDDNCKYGCMHSFVDNIRSGSQWHQFYGKWPFYRLGPIQEPMSVVFSLGNLWVHLKGMEEVRRRVHTDNALRTWLLVLGGIQVNTWVWSTVFHFRDLPITERLDYFSATLTISFSMLYTLLRVFNLITPSGATRLAAPCVIVVALVAVSHFTYLLSFPVAYGSFPYGYHTAFNVALALVHSFSWIGWTSSFYIPAFTEFGWPKPYPPMDPIKFKSANAATPALLVGLTTVAMSFELLDFAPLFRMLDAHAMWHLSTIPLAMAWWHFLCSDAIELESAQMQGKSNGGVGIPGQAGVSEKMPLTGGGPSIVATNVDGESEKPAQEGADGAAGQGEGAGGSRPTTPFTPNVPAFAKLAAGIGLPSRGTPGKSPGGKERED